MVWEIEYVRAYKELLVTRYSITPTRARGRSANAASLARQLSVSFNRLMELPMQALSPSEATYQLVGRLKIRACLLSQ